MVVLGGKHLKTHKTRRKGEARDLLQAVLWSVTDYISQVWSGRLTRKM